MNATSVRPIRLNQGDHWSIKQGGQLSINYTTSNSKIHQFVEIISHIKPIVFYVIEHNVMQV